MDSAGEDGPTIDHGGVLLEEIPRDFFLESGTNQEVASPVRTLEAFSHVYLKSVAIERFSCT